jgi:hypothetical protein
MFSRIITIVYFCKNNIQKYRNMKKIITIAIMIICMLTRGYCHNVSGSDCQSNDRTSNMRSSSTRSTVNNNNSRNNNTSNAEPSRPPVNNMYRSGVTGGMRSGFISSFSGNRTSSQQRKDNSTKNDRTRNNNNGETQTNNKNN